MNEEVELYIDDASERMQTALKHLDVELLKIRAGKADPSMLDGIMVDYYGTSSPLNQVANVGISDVRTIMIQPWDRSMIQPIEKAIMKANLGFNPLNNGEAIRITVPALTEERRKQLAKQARQEGESAKISIRNVRRDANEEFKKMKKDGLSEDMAKNAEAKIQDLTNAAIKKIETMIEEREKTIMTV